MCEDCFLCGSLCTYKNLHYVQYMYVHITTFFACVYTCRYFPEEATQEILDEWLPYLCPFDTAAVDALTYMEFLLPTVLPPRLHGVGFRSRHHALDIFVCHVSPSCVGMDIYQGLNQHGISYKVL